MNARCLFTIGALVTTLPLCGAAVADTALLPFKASFTTQEQLRLDPAACPGIPFLAGTTTGSGTATRMGASTLLATDCITPLPGTFVFSGGKLTLTGANGDQITADYSGALLPTAELPTYAISGAYRVTGGTGRFIHARGAGIIQGRVNTSTGQGGYEVKGILAY